MAVIQRRIAPTPLPGARITATETPESMGAGVLIARERTLQQVGDTFAQGANIALEMAKHEQDNANETALLKASNQLASWKTQTLYDPQNGALTKQGEDAMPLPEQVADSFNKTADQIEAGLGNNTQKAEFAKMRAQEFQSVDLEVRRHVFTQMQEFKATELKSAIDNGTNEAIRNANDPTLVANSLDKTEAQMRVNLPKLGVGPQQLEQQVRDVRSTVHVGVISQLLAQDQDQKASQYFAEVKDQINGDALDNVTKAVDEGSLRGSAQRTTDAIMAPTTGEPPKTLDDAMKQVTTITDPKLRDEVQQRVEHQFTLSDRAEAEAEKQAMISGYDIIDKTGSVAKIPTPVWSAYSGATRSAMIGYARMRAEGTPIKTDQPTFYALMTQAGDDPQAFAKVNLLTSKTKLSDGDFQQLASLQLSVKNNERTGRNVEDLAAFSTKQDLINNTLAGIGYPTEPSKQTAPQRLAVAELYRMVDRSLDAVQAPDPKTGRARKATTSEIQQAIDFAVGQSENVPGSWRALYNPFAYNFRDSTKRLIDTTIDQIPAAERQDITKALSDSHQPITDQTIIDLYVRLHSK